MSLDLDTAVRLAAFAAIDRLERQHGPVFVRPDPQAPGWDETVGGLPRVLLASPSPLAALRFRGRRTYDVRANWKVVRATTLG